ncbi:stage II sporulation protein R [Eubacteriales bacterium OttesenSCG-928-N13]|nr:stage II sporulation protein R [Eubacteriales bacterium OttesenSCG-928-N13]
MRARFFCVLLALLLCLPMGARADMRQHVSTQMMVRLQVKADSDSPRDQRIKLIVRDAVRAYTVPLVADANHPDDAYQILKSARADIQQVAMNAARDAGFGGSVRAQLGVMPFPIRLYGKTLVPAGDYRALRITLGSGAGRNWWCVIYPDFCTTDEVAAEALAEGEPVEFYSSIWETLNRWFGKDEQE